MVCKNCHNENIDGVKFCFFCGRELSDLTEEQTINDTANNDSIENTKDVSSIDNKQNHNLNSKNKKIIAIAGSVILGITILISISIIFNLYNKSSNNNESYSGYNGSIANDNEKYTSSSYLDNNYSEDDILDSEDNSMDDNKTNDDNGNMDDVYLNNEDSYLDDDYLYDDDNNEENNSGSDDITPFYGIWCFASQKQSEAYNFANELSDDGWNALVVTTTDWSNLNNEKWYVVSAGVYDTYDAASKELDDIKSIFPSAYIKYSGEHN